MDFPGDLASVNQDPTASIAGENWDQAIWATEDDYRAWNSSSSGGDVVTIRTGPDYPNKKPRNNNGGSSESGGGSGGRSKAIGRMFFKTKLCCKFRAGTCPYITNCNFAHGIEELRKPPPNWQEIVASSSQDDPSAVDPAAPPREEHQIPSIVSSGIGGESQRSYKGRHCKKFYTEEGCPYGDMCTFLHDEQSKARESVAIRNTTFHTKRMVVLETELHRYGGGLVDTDGRDSASVTPDAKQAGASSKVMTDVVVASNSPVPRSDVYHMVPAQRTASGGQWQEQRPLQKWKGPDKINRIYGDWIDDDIE
ncbi:Zinc finger CCCH domain-containing protein 56 [Acorus calamus]|uniref:Zinc finger CCCH domain-containing protein 56 n=1 Tax=Acorus calamus TaxID=4465 RepID=A0AAV9E2Q3_ACOCL|nr:Zinc finger CCCH domain-containing protein 56 [Acorus calamus]